MRIFVTIIFIYLNLIASELNFTNKPSIDIIAKNKTFYLKFANYSENLSNLNNKILETLKNDGFTNTNDENASIVIKFTINYFNQAQIPKTNGGYVNLGIGFGSNGYRQKSVEIGYILNNISKNKAFDNIYQGNASMLIQITNKENQTKEFLTNLDYIGDCKDPQKAMNDFENLVSKEISKLLFMPNL